MGHKSFPRSGLRVTLVKQELIRTLEHLRSPPIVWRVRDAHYSVLF